MKANRSIRSDRAEVGVGTLIVFIAMVLVAAVAAAVLINTTGTLQQRAQQTGQQATQDVSSNLKIINVFGVVTGGDIDELRVNAQLSAGAPEMDLEQLIIRYSDGTNTFNYVWTDAYDDGAAACNPDDAATDTVDTGGVGIVEVNFISLWLRPTATNANDYGCADASVLTAGDLVELRFNLAAARDLAERTTAHITLIPESGGAVQVDFTTPATYSGNTYITLR